MNCRACHKEMDDTPFCPLCGTEQAPEGKGKRTRRNGSGTAYKLPNGKWRAEVTIGWDGKKRIVKTKSGFTRKKDALAAIPALFNAPMDINSKITFKSLYELWSASHYEKIGKDTENGYKAAYKHCEPLYYRQFTALKSADLQAVVDSCPLSRRTKADIKSLMLNMYRYAIENDYCSKNYAEFIKLPPKPKSKKDAFTADERQKLWKDYESGNIFTGYILLMIYTGLRFGELAKITKDNVHLSERYMIGGIKTEAGTNRVIPINNRIYPIVEKFYNAGKKKILEMHEKVFYNDYRCALERLGIRYLTPHCCRHTFATMMAGKGIQPAIITEAMGHEDYATTIEYTHIPLTDLLAAVDTLE